MSVARRSARGEDRFVAERHGAHRWCSGLPCATMDQGGVRLSPDGEARGRLGDAVEGGMLRVPGCWVRACTELRRGWLG